MNSTICFERAQKIIPGGVNSPVRSFSSVGGTPPFIDRAKGPYIYDVEGNQYIDYIGSWGPMILGHSNDAVVNAVIAQAKRGLSYGASCELETTLAQLISANVPSIKKIRFVNSGTEASMSALRVARAFTNRDIIVKFSGCYHGHADALLVEAGSGALTCQTPSSPGVPASTTKHTITLPYNDIAALITAFESIGSDIAAVIIEPIAGNMNMVKPQAAFLTTLKSLCDQHRSLLIFDEVMTGFRVALGGAQALYDIQPDLTCLGKIIGGGLPVGAFGGREEIMALLAPEGPVYQAGTLSGNPMAMTAGIATLTALTRPNVYAQLTNKTKQLMAGIKDQARTHNIALQTSSEGGMFGLMFTDRPVHSLQDVQAANLARFNRFFHYMLKHGHYFAPSPYEAGFMSLSHQDQEISQTIQATGQFFAEENQ